MLKKFLKTSKEPNLFLKTIYTKMEKVLKKDAIDFINSDYKETDSYISWEGFLGKNDGDKKSEDDYFVTSMQLNSLLEIYSDPIIDSDPSNKCTRKFELEIPD